MFFWYYTFYSSLLLIYLQECQQVLHCHILGRIRHQTYLKMQHNIVVLPFIDDILTNDPNFIGFKRVEKNKWYKHDIIMNYSIDLNRDNKINF